MAIPNFTSDGLLPMSIHNATLAEIKEKFCSFGDADKRNKLYNMFIKYLESIKKHKVKFEIYIDGSFVTDKEEPGDIDILIFFDYEYNNTEWLQLLYDDWVRKHFPGIQVLSGFLESSSKDGTLDFAHNVKNKPGLRKGLIKVIL